MSIAQHFVAGEGFDHARDLETLDQHAQTLWSCDATNLPWVIFRAAFRAAHMHDLSRRAADLLSALARTVNRAQPQGRIFIHRDKLSTRARQSMRTLYRSLDDLEAAGLIERPAQERVGEDNRFGRAYLHLTQVAIDRLGFADKTSAQAALADEKKSRSASDSAAPSATVADASIKNYLYPEAFQKRHPAGSMPEDLQRLRSLGFHDFLIFKLMREAREHGKRLSDVVETVWKHLQVAKWPICYLRKLLTQPVDFRFQLVQRKAENQQAAHQAASDLEALETAKRAAGKRFVSFDNKSEYSVSDDGQVLTVVHAGERIPRVSLHGWATWFADALKERRIVVSATETICATPRDPGISKESDAHPSRDLSALVGMLRSKTYAKS